jgi:dCTP deaminase
VSFWSGAKLRDKCKAQSIIEPFIEKQIDCSAYTLRMGHEFYVTPSYGYDLRKNTKQHLKEQTEVDFLGTKWARKGGELVIPPGQFAFLLTEERVNMPDNSMGFISLKSGTKFRGLVNISGFHVDPGFKGNLIYSVFNAGPSPIHLCRGDDVFLLWITDLSGPTEKNFVRDDKVPQVEISSRLVSDVAREAHSLQALSERVERLGRLVTTLITGAIIVATVIGLVFASNWLSAQAKMPAVTSPPAVLQPSTAPAASAAGSPLRLPPPKAKH